MEEKIADKIIQFYDNFEKESFDLPSRFKVINPLIGEQKEQVREIMQAFYTKYYNDVHKRRIIFGSSPARRGSAVIGVPFEDADHLQKETGIYIHNFYIQKSSSNFLFDIMRLYGGCKKFYSDFYMNFVCPLGIVKINADGKEVNCNYYDNKQLQKSLYPFIVESIRKQICFGMDTSVCYCIGSGENYKFLSAINQKYHFFGEIIPLEHPRFIMQYHPQCKSAYIDKYLNALCKSPK